MANVSPPRRGFQPPPILNPKASDRVAVPKYDIVDPLLGNLSPESTLQALSSTDAVPTNEQAAQNILSKSIFQASPSERALGIRAAIAAQKLGQWYKEVQMWNWPKRTDAQLGKGFIPPSDAEEFIYYGSLPAAVVQQHEDRIEEIREGMDNLNVEELKEHVLNAHVPGRSRPSSANSTMSVPPPLLSYVQLSDFTAVITATILRALPLLSRMNALLASWDVRLLVLRQIPGLLHSLRFARSELNTAADLFKSSAVPTEKDALYSMANYHAKRASLESTVLSAGRRIDRILDSLDGREDSLPEHWIDDLEAIEADFASWVMLAEKRTVENEWRRLSARSNENTKPVESTQLELPQAEETLPEPAPAEVEILPEAEMSREIVIKPEPVLHPRPSLLQLGRSHPMETIVEEVGSPFGRPLSQSTGNVIDSPSKSRAEPESPSPLPVDTSSTKTLDPVPVMQLDSNRNDTPEYTRDVEAVEDVLHSPANLSAVEEPPQLEEPSSDISTEPRPETSAHSDELRIDVNTEESPSALDNPPVEEPKKPSDECPTDIETRPMILPEPTNYIEIEENTPVPPDMPVEALVHQDVRLDKDRPSSSDSSESVIHMPARSEGNISHDLNFLAEPDVTSTDLSNVVSVPAEVFPQDTDSAVQLLPEEPQPTTQASLLNPDTTAILPDAESTGAESASQEVESPVKSSLEQHACSAPASPVEPDTTSTALPDVEPVAESVPRVIAPVQSSVEQHQQHAEAPPIRVDTTPADLPFVGALPAESVAQDVSPVESFVEEHQQHAAALSVIIHSTSLPFVEPTQSVSVPQVLAPKVSSVQGRQQLVEASPVKTDTSSTNLPAAESLQAQPVAQAIDAPIQLLLEDQPQAEAAVSAATETGLPTPPVPTPEREPLPANDVTLPVIDLSANVGEEYGPIPAVIATVEEPPTLEHDNVLLVDTLHPTVEEDIRPTLEIEHQPQPILVKAEPIVRHHAVTEASGLESPESSERSVPERCVTPPGDNVASLPNLFVPHENSKAPEQPHSGEYEQDDNTLKKPLDSPIKLSRPGRLELDKQKSKSRVRRTSNGSDGSLSDYPSLVSSQEPPEPRTSSSNGTPLLLETPPHFPKDCRPTASTRHDHTLREDRLLHLDAQKPSPRDLSHNRTLSLPLQRFINESFDVNYETSGSDDVFGAKSGHKRAPGERRQKSENATSFRDIARSKVQRPEVVREMSSGPDSDGANDRLPKVQSRKERIAARTAEMSTPVEPLTNVATERLKQRLTAHPSLESIGPYKSDAQPANKVLRGKTKSHSSSLNKSMLRPKDQMDEKINSILTSLPGQIHLVPADQDDDAISVASTVPYRRERLRSDSPQGTPTRSFTPTPSLMLRPALTRRRHSHAPEDSSVKLYHLHSGGRSAPTKLFVRTVGENGERVMVRVGGGWADLAEYLREYALHHGRRHVSETPRVEIEGLTPRQSPSISPPSSRVPSGTRQMPPRPGSVISNRPASSLAARKTRRSSNVSDLGDHRIASAGDALNVTFSPMPGSTLNNRRLSVSSNVSTGAMSSISELRHGSPGAPTVPLGLAGPKPRAKHSTISPESEAWVEDVLGQARRSSSLRPFKYTLPPPEVDPEGNTPTLPKSRSISDIGKAGSSKRVVLRGLR